MFNTCKHGDGLRVLQDFISVLTDAIDDVRALSTTVDGVSENAILKSNNARFLDRPPRTISVAFRLTTSTRTPSNAVDDVRCV